MMQDAFDNYMDGLGGEWFDSKVAGVTHRNADGESRQDIARTLQPYEELELRPEPDNAFDKNAIAVCAPDGRQIGYVEGRLAAELTRRLARGIRARCFVRAVREKAGICGVSFALIQFKE